MPKRSLNLHENTIESSEENDNDIDLTLQDYMEHPKTKEMIENQHFLDDGVFFEINYDAINE